MRHFASPSFWESYEKLPISIKKLANKNFTLLKNNPRHPSLHFKQVNEYWSVRVGKKYRCLGIEIKQGLLWFWTCLTGRQVGTHAEYDSMIRGV